MSAILCAMASIAPAQGIQLNASVDQARVEVGSIIVYSLEISSVSQMNANPTMPDFGGLQVVNANGPFRENRMTIINGSSNVSTILRWQLRAPTQGTFTIGSSQLEYGGRTYRSRPITVTVTMQAPPIIPDDLKHEGILPAQSNNAAVNKQLNGRLFLRVEVSDKKPYVSEPVLVTYKIYWDNIPIRGLQYPNEQLKAGGGLLDERFRAQGDIQPVTETHGDRAYQVAPILQYTLTPTQPGDAEIGAYFVAVQLPVQRQSGRGPFDDSFFGDPFGANTMQVQLPSAPVKLEVRPLPTDGQPANFSATVGSFTLKASADRSTMRQDELLTLDVTLEGRGAVELASPPRFPDNDAFEVVDQTARMDTARPKDYVGGTKHFQYSLRPRKFGRIQVPSISYPVFDSEREAYRTLRTDPVPVTVQPLPQGVAAEPAAPGGASVTRKVGNGPQLNFVQAIGSVRHGRVEPAMESPLMWLFLVGGSALILAMWYRDWRRATLDPAAARRNGAWRAFEKRLRRIKAKGGDGRNAEVAGAFEHAVRNLIADHYNTSAEGMTRDEIARLLAGSNLTREQVARLLERLDACAWASYSPVDSPIDVRAWSEETRAVLREGLRA